MTFSVICFTQAGYELAKRITRGVPEINWKRFVKCQRLVQEREVGDDYVETSVQVWAGEQMKKHRGLLFVGAAGIAVRSIAPYVDNKLTDEPVLVADEKGQYVIPLLAGHVGRANETARRIAEALGAVSVVTTATDVQQKTAIDVWAGQQGMTIQNKEAIASVSAKIVAGEPVVVSLPKEYLPDVYVMGKGEKGSDLLEESKRVTLILEPKEYILGIGCKQNKSLKEIEQAVFSALSSLSLSIEQVGCIASVDNKAKEPGLIAFSEKYRIPFVTYSSEVLSMLAGNFSDSDFVKETVGVGNVCERAAMAACEGTGKLVSKKRAKEGVTVAVAKRKWRICLDEA